MTTTFALRPQSRPDHVPDHLYWDHDLTEFAASLESPYHLARHFTDAPPVVFARGASFGQPGWMPTSYQVLEEIFLNPTDFSSTEGNDITKMIGVDWRLNPLEYDPPEHGKFRRVIQPMFMPGEINKLDDMIRGILTDLISKIETRNACEFVSEFSSSFPSRVFLKLMGMPEEMLPHFLDWEHAFLRAPVLADRIAAAHSIRDYLESYVAERRAGPRRGDLTDLILQGEIDGQPLKHGETMGMCMVLYLGGLDTVMNSMGWHFSHLAQDQALQERLRQNPEDIPAAVDDFLRAYGVTMTRRVVARDMDFHGAPMKKGDFVVMPTAMASRDARRFGNPDLVDPDRKARHMTFATGPHNCLGIHLAKRELKIVFEEWLKRFTNIRIAEGETYRWHTKAVWGVNYLPLQWDHIA